jgi:AraC-like DNA-binding protein
VQRGTLHWWIEDHEYRIEPGQLFMTLPDETHGGHGGIMDPCDLYWMSFNLNITGALGLQKGEATAMDQALRTATCRHCRADMNITEHYDRILATLAQPNAWAAALIRSTLTFFIHHVLGASAQAAEVITKPQDALRIQSAISWMREHLENPISIDDIAAQADLSLSQFRHVFRSETGFSPQDYLTQLRIEAAKRLLNDAALSITDVALQTGFTSSQYFATMFKRSTGFSPREYRASSLP